MSEKILIVEDDEKLAALLKEYLDENGHPAEIVGRGDLAVVRILSGEFALVILDLMLPGIDGLEVCRRVRDKFTGAILMLTARKGDVDEVLGLELGADDYVTKPVYPRVLLARVRSLLRRLEPRREESLIAPRTMGILILDKRRREARVGDRPVKLTSIEFDILWVLSSSPGEVVTRDALYREVHGSEYDGLDRGMDIHVSRIRQKLAALGIEGSAIKSVRGAGYLLALA